MAAAAKPRAHARSARGRLQRVAAMLGMAWLPMAATATQPDLAAAARAIVGFGQGVYVQAADGSVLVAQAAAHPVHPASVSKLAATLALLHTLGPDYRFVTTFAATGPIAGDRLDGDLLVTSNGDPALVDENALLVVERLNALGIRRIAGDLRARGLLMFDWQHDDDGARLRAALSGQVAPAAWAAVQALESAPADAHAGGASTPPALLFDADGLDRSGREHSAEIPTVPTERVLLVHRSESLLSLAKDLNDYSNNVFIVLAASAGGAAAIERLARAAVPRHLRTEIVLQDAAGADVHNRLSPRAAVELLRALERELASSGHALTDILPVAGVDPGTLHDRLNGGDERGCVVGKTGTFGDYGASALVGAVRSADRGTIYFAILNHGVPVPEARRRQDRFVQQLLRSMHALPWTYQRDPHPAIARVRIQPQTS